MRAFFLVYFIFTIFLYSNVIENKIKKEVQRVIQTDEQRKIYNQLQKNQNINPTKSYKVDKIEIQEKKDENCIEIKKIKISGSTIYKNNDFKYLIEPLINKCVGITKLNNFTKEISNKYIEDGYITSRAYIKAQDLSNKVVNIDIVEGKINNIETMLKPDFIFQRLKGNILNIRDLEVGIGQVERLRSQKIDLELVASQKVGYTNIKIIKKDNHNPYYGNISINNYGVDTSGKYQISGNYNYENLLNLNDIISVGINTTDKIGGNTDSLGNSISYSFPISRYLFTIDYSSFKYKQRIPYYDEYYKTNGTSQTVGFNLDYKFYHSLQKTLDIYFNIKSKQNKNYYNGIFLDVQSYDLNIGTLGIKYSYNSNLFQLYSTFSFQKSFSDKKNDYFNTEFNKYVLDIGITKYFEKYPQLKLNSSFYGQYSNYNLPGTESINIGGPYSVRGFNHNDISGNRGFYIRNEISTTKKNKYFQYTPYLAIDYGFIKKDKYVVNSNSMIGEALGLRIIKNNFLADMYYSFPLKEDKGSEIKSKFFGVNISYSF